MQISSLRYKLKPVLVNTRINLPQAQAFMRFTADLNQWWPREFTWSREALQTIGIELHRNGFCYERGPFGFQCYWGRIIRWEPPARLSLAWQIGPDGRPEPNPEKSSTVLLNFKSTGPEETELTLEHCNFENHGTDCEYYRNKMASPGGWPSILECYASGYEPAGTFSLKTSDTRA